MWLPFDHVSGVITAGGVGGSEWLPGTDGVDSVGYDYWNTATPSPDTSDASALNVVAWSLGSSMFIYCRLAKPRFCISTRFKHPFVL